MSEHPDAARLRLFLDLAGEFEEIADHIQTCRACEALLAELATPDSDSLPTTPLVAPSDAGEGGLPTVPDYDLVGLLGKGGCGVVYQARHQRLQRVVALKMIRPGAWMEQGQQERFRSEAATVAQLCHPNIVQIYEIGESGGQPFLALEYCAGGSLEKKLQGKPVSPREAAALVEQLARAMQVVHDQSIVHRDLKPANVLLMEDGTPKITDFGLARRVEEAGQTRTGTILGTPEYMAPEQTLGQSRNVGPAADIYALGVILYELLTGRPPFQSQSVWETLAQVREQEPVSPRQLQPRTSRDLETICLKCLNKEPARRYRSALELAEDLLRYKEGKPVQARPVGRLERGRRWCRRNPAVASLMAALLLVFAAGTTSSVLFAIDAEKEASEALRQKGEAKNAQLRAEESERTALAEKRTAEFLVYASRLRQAQIELERGNHEAAQEILALCDSRFMG